MLAYGAVLLLQPHASALATDIFISADNFSASVTPLGQGFFGTAPLPDHAGYEVALEALTDRPTSSAFRLDDPWMKKTLPQWTGSHSNNIQH